MRPGQTTPLVFEVAILEAIAKEHGLAALAWKSVHVLSRKFTGVGSFTEFSACPAVVVLEKNPLLLSAQIVLPQLKNGLGALLFVEDCHPKCLEVYAYGEELWDGTAHDFRIVRSA